jgi:hypothetical protein
MLVKSLVLPVFIGGLFFIIVLSIMALLACLSLQRMPNNENEGNTRNSWTGPERSSYIAIIATWLLFIVSSIFLLASDEIFKIIMGIGLTVFSIQILATTSILAFAVMNKKRQSINATKILPTTIIMAGNSLYLIFP